MGSGCTVGSGTDYMQKGHYENGRKIGITPQQVPMSINRKMEKIKSV